MSSDSKTFFNEKIKFESLRYWLAAAAFLAVLAYAIHRYFEYRNAELDKRLERLR